MRALVEAGADATRADVTDRTPVAAAAEFAALGLGKLEPQLGGVPGLPLQPSNAKPGAVPFRPLLAQSGAPPNYVAATPTLSALGRSGSANRGAIFR